MSDLTAAVLMAAASDINDELSIVLNGIDRLIDDTSDADPLRHIMLDIRAASQRIVWKTAGMLSYSVRQGSKPTPICMERVMQRAEI